MSRQTPYLEHRPHPELQEHVACYWSIRCRQVPEAVDEDAVVPDACMDVLFDLTANSADVIGTMTRPLAVHRSATMDLLGIRFRPGGIGAFVRLPAPEVTDGFVGLGELWGPDADRLTSRLGATSDTAARIALLDAVLRDRLSAARSDGPILEAARVVERSEGRIRVEDLARTAGLSRRQLERRFLAAVGIAPKVACRVVRFQAALRRLRDAPGQTLAAIALETGYHDQAHLTREFTALAGVAPGAWRAGRDAFVQDGAAGDA
ncbi:MAG: DUF6597 domain-containing transcriptional factor [Gemmatimonadales bacterium]